MEIIGLEKDERILAKAEKSGERVLWTIISQVFWLILWFAVLNPLFFEWCVSQYSVSYESWRELIISALTTAAADYLIGIVFLVLDTLCVLEAVASVICAAVRHSRRELYLTDRRIFGHTGNLLLGKREINFPLSQISGIFVRKSAAARLFRYGMIKINTPLGQYSVDGIGNPHDFLRRFNQSKISSGAGIQEEEQEALSKEYAEMLEEDGIPYRETEAEEKTEPILERNERIIVFISAGMYLLEGIMSLFLLNGIFETMGRAPWTWLDSPFGGGAIIGVSLVLLIIVLMVRLEPLAYQFLQFVLMFSMTVTGFAALLLLADENFSALLPQLLLLTASGVHLYLVRYILEVLGSTVQRYRRGRGH